MTWDSYCVVVLFYVDENISNNLNEGRWDVKIGALSYVLRTLGTNRIENENYLRILTVSIV